MYSNIGKIIIVVFCLTFPTYIESEDSPVPVGASTLAFVFDITGSMYDDLVQVIEGAAKILATSLARRQKPLHNYVLVPFHDPEVGPVTITEDDEEFQRILKSLYVQGGGDCPEMSIKAIKVALSVSLPNSFIYVFTDARSKDFYLTEEVLTLIQQKQSQVVFVLTGDCGNATHEGYVAYEKIASTSSGQVFSLKKDQVDEVLNFVRVTVQAKRVNLMSIDRDNASSGTFEIPIDSKIKEFTVSVSGSAPEIQLWNPDGKEITRKNGLRQLLNLKKVKIVNVRTKGRVPGKWQLTIESNSSHTIRVTGLSNADFVIGFSRKLPKGMSDTELRPLKGVPSYAMINMTGLKPPGKIDTLQLVDLKGEILAEYPVNQNKAEYDLYTIDPFTPPDTFFFLKIIGTDKEGYTLWRTTPTAISPRNPSLPVLYMPEITRGFYYTTASIVCAINSEVPYSVQWYRDGVKEGLERYYSESDNVTLEIPYATSSEEGIYICSATNAAGRRDRTTFLDISEPPPEILPPDHVSIFPSFDAILTCSIYSTVPYNITWYGPGGIIQSNRKFEVLTNGSLLIRDVSLKNEGQYVCRAENEGGFSQEKVFLRVQVPPRAYIKPEDAKFVAGGTVKLTCFADGYPEPTFYWEREGKSMVENERVEINANQLNLQSMVRGDEGAYKCTAKNTAGQDSVIGMLQYIEKPRISTYDKTIPVASGNDAVLICRSEGIPKPTIHWYKGEWELKQLDYVNISGNGDLTIEKVGEEDEGDYRCVAQNDAGEDSVLMYLEVGSAPRFTKIPYPASANLFTNMSFPCEATGDPPPKNYWKKNGSPIVPSKKGRFHKDPSGALFITDVSPGDDGTYTCLYQNKYGEIETSADLIVTGIDKPLIAYTNPYLNVIQGNDVGLSCVIIEGNPPPTTQWYKQGQVLEMNEYFSHGSPGEVLISNIQEVHEGEYTCVASNWAGNATFSVTINVQVPPRHVYSTDVDRTRNFSVIQGDGIILPCNVTGDPRPTITWYKDESPISLIDYHYIIQDDGSLEIFSTDAEDTGQYRCSASNVAGDIDKVIDLFVKVRPLIQGNDVEEYIVIENQTILLPCEVSGRPTPSVSWRKLFVPFVPVSDRFLFSPVGLTITKAHIDDMAIYECIAENEAGESVKVITLVVQIPPMIISDGDTSLTVLEGESTTLNCETSGDPTPVVQWKKEDVIIDTLDTELEIMGTGSLRIKSVKLSDDGVYRCISTNPAGNAVRDFSLTVHAPPVLPVDLENSTEIIENNPKILHCPAVGTPLPSIRWYKDGLEITDGIPGIEILPDGSLELQSSQASDSARYKCVASNVAGSVEYTVDLSVLIPPKVVDDEDGGLDGRMDIDEVIVNNSITLNCTVEGDPQPSIIWEKGGNVMVPDGVRIQISEDGQRLTINNARVSDKALYKCIATNVAGQTEMNFEIDVFVPPTIDDMSASPSNLSVIIASSQFIDCPISGTPPPEIMWYKDGEVISPEVDTNYQTFANGRRLEIRNADITDNGLYRCEGVNAAGKVEREFDLEVFIPPTVENPGDIDTQEVIRDKTLQLSCPASGTPRPKIIWFKGNKAIKVNSTRYVLLDDGWKLEIRDAQTDDSTRFTCRAQNEAGTTEKAFDLNVLVPPDIIEQSIETDQKVTVNRSIAISCPVEGIPSPLITWYKDGVRLDVGVNPQYEILSEGRQLRIRNAQLYNTGLFTCKAKNKAGTDELSYNLQVQVPSRIDKYNIDTSPKVIVNETLTVFCPASGVPLPTIVWFKGGSKITEGSSPNIQISEDRLKLQILNAQVEDTAKYTCQATNEAGSAELNFDVFVEVPPSIINVTDVKPNIKEGQTFTIQCPAVGTPEPDIQWLKNGEMINFETESSLHLQNGGKELLVHDAQVEDGGIYTCVASNPAGVAEMEFELDVWVPPVIDRTAYDTQTEVVRGHTTVLNCPATGLPPPKIEWFKNDKPLILNSHMQLVTGGLQLKIINATLKDTARYSCKAENPAGIATAEMDLSVQVPPSIDESNLVYNPRVLQNRTVILDCPVSGVPEPEVRWLINDAPLQVSNRVLLKRNRRQVEIHKAQVIDSAGYTCIATNDAGELQRTFRLQVLVPPSILQDLVSSAELTVKQNQSISIFCPVDGVPFPSILWLKDKAPLLDFPYRNLKFTNSDQQLEVISAQVEDAGQYTCTVTNQAGQIKRNFDLRVHVPPIIDGAGTTIRVIRLEQQTATFECPTVGIPEPSVTWYKDDKPIEDLSSVVQVLSGGQELQILSSQVTDTAKYTCIAENVAGEAKKFFELEIHVPPSVDDLTVQEKSVMINSDLTLSCPAEGIPPPKIAWKRQNDIIPQYGNPSVKIQDGGRKLLLVNAQLLDSGEYSCVATNPAGSAYMDFYITVLVPPTIEEGISPRVVVEIVNNRALLSCQSVGLPEPQVTWTKNFNPFPSSGLRHRMLPGGSLEFTSVRVADNGTYVCTATNSAGSASRKVELIVQVPPQILGRQRVAIRGVRGKDVVLPCTVTGSPEPRIMWQKGASILRSGGTRMVSQNGSLVIRDLKARDSGAYICIARNSAGTKVKQVILLVQEPPKISDGQRDFKVQQTQRIVLPCNAKGRPRPKIRWLKEGIPVQNRDARLSQLRSGWLFIPYAEPEVAGTYTCIAENIAGSDQSDFHLTVYVPPEILKSNKILVASIGETAIIECTSIGEPKPKTQWRKDGRMLRSDGKYRVEDSGRLLISNLEPDDTGSYTCIAYSPAGRDSHEQTLRVQVPPKITQFPQNTEVVIKEKIYLSCAATGIPIPSVTWTRNGESVPTTPSINGRSFVAISHAVRQDAGMYKCIAENPAGVATASATVLMKVPPRVTVPDGDTVVTVAEKVILTCSVGGDPSADIQWIKDGRVVELSDRIKSLANGSLVIFDSTTSDAGSYKCVASNDAGVSFGIAMLTVREPPEFKIEPVNTRVDEGETVIMNCVAEGEPTPAIAWLRGWSELELGGRFSVLPNNSLRIVSSQLSDSDVYKCKAYNELGITIVEATFTVVVHGQFTLWSTWGICSSTCGNGIQFRTRSCEDPPPQNGGRSCIGDILDSKPCVSGECPVDGQWGNWLTWGDCSTTCGTGERTRKRLCNNPPPLHGGKNCEGESFEEGICSQQYCAVDGNWGMWSQWSLCSTTCGDGLQERSRDCDSPAPQHMGQPCTGKSVQQKSCSSQECAVDGNWGQWKKWSQCSQSCGGGIRNRSRSCNNPRPVNGGSYCGGRGEQLDYCNPQPCPVHGSWSPWGSWGDCSASCGRSHRKRFRSCSSPAPSYNGRTCIGPSEDSQPCNTINCPVDGLWLEWGPWLPCSKTCDTGVHERRRVCKVPQHGGQNCIGNSIQRDDCFLQACLKAPLHADGNLLGAINGQVIENGKLSAVITSSTDGSGATVNASIDNVPKSVAESLQYLVSVLNPVYWTVAEEVDGAYNGFTLTDGKFYREVQVEFVTGEVLQMKHMASGVDNNGVLQVDVIVQGQVPRFPTNSQIQLVPYTENYLQTSKGHVYAYSSRTFRLDGEYLPYAWNHSITYEKDEVMPYLVQKLHTKSIRSVIGASGDQIQFTLQSSITQGTPSNQCPQGFNLDDDGLYCSDDDECQSKQVCSHYCHNSPGKFSCSCPLGFSLDSRGRNCLDIDECKANTGRCSDGYRCINTVGSYNCGIVCGSGYVPNRDNDLCEDIDECKDSPDVCDHHCNNLPGSYSCSCSDGFSLQQDGRCIDINECRNGESKCTDMCRNSIGSYRCFCPVGYRLADRYTCIDIDECLERTARCSVTQDCVNVKGSYKCVQHCQSGYRQKDGFCIDIDECKERENLCHTQQKCINSEGSYYCQCEKGYKSGGPGYPCVDINECAEYPGICSYRCTNTNGDYQCICPPGQKQLADKKSCAGLEYLEPSQVSAPFRFTQSSQASGRSQMAGCWPSYKCNKVRSGRRKREICQIGYRYTPAQSKCIDIDECVEDPEICQYSCTNNIGSFICSCPSGYRLARNGRNCIDINECLDPDVNCGPGKMCFNKRGGYSCIDTPCPLNYKRDQLTKYCVLECVDSVIACPPGTKYADVIEFRTLALPSGIAAGQDLIRLTAYNQDDVMLPKTDFDILENDQKIEFQLRLVNGTGILYTLKQLDKTETYQIKVRARSYDEMEEYLQYQTNFIIHISVSAYPF